MLRRSCARKISEYQYSTKLTQHFGGIYMTPHKAGPIEDKGIQTTKLANGAKVVTHDRQGLQATVGFYADAGAKYDPSTAPGLNYVMRWAMLSSNFSESLFQIDRKFRACGGSYEHSEISKRYLGWKSDVRRDHFKVPLNVFATCIAAPRFPESDIERFRDTMDNILEERRFQQPHEYVADQLEDIAFWKEPLGNPRFVPPFNNDFCSSKVLTDQWASHMSPSRITIAGVNVDHQELVAAYTQAEFPHDASAPHHAGAAKPTLAHTEEKAQYRPGREKHEVENRAAVMGSSSDMRADTIAAVGWLTNGREGTLKDYATSCIVQEILGQSVGGNAAIRRSSDDDGARTFYRPYSTAGLVGFTLKGPAGDAKDLITSTAKLPKDDEVTAEAVDAAKNAAIMRQYSNELEVQRDYLDFIATSAFGVNDFALAAKAVTPADVTKELKAMRSQAPCFFATGSVQGLPSLKQLNLK